MDKKQIIVGLPSIKNTNSKPKIYPSTEYVLYFDGCSKGNPGPSGIGAVIYRKGVEHWAACKYIGNNKTNNEAEYSALILGLKFALEQDITTLSVCGDSLLVINQVNKIYKVKHPILAYLYDEVVKLMKQFTYIDFSHVYRNQNKRADQLSNIALEFIDNKTEIHSTIIDDDIIEDNTHWKEESIIYNILQKIDKK